MLRQIVRLLFQNTPLLGFSLALALGVVGCQGSIQSIQPPATTTSTPSSDPAAQAQAVPPSPTPIPAAALQNLSTEEQLTLVDMPARDLRALTIRLRPEVDEVPLVVNATSPDYQVGDTIEFWVHDLGSNDNQRITAELIYRTDVAYAWIETGATYDRTAISQAVERFSTQSYPAAVAFFGSEWKPGVDGDPHIHILHTNQLGGGVAGYFSSADEYSRLANAISNEKELFYINLTWLNSTGAYTYYETVLAHEFQHMIHWHHDSNEWAWVNEGLSEYTQEVTGFGVDTTFINAFLNQPDSQLNSWNLVSGSNAEHYGAAYLFMRYLNQRFGPSILQTLVDEPTNSTEGVQLALQSAGHDLTFDQVFADWVVANYANQPNALGEDGRYGHRDINLATPATAEQFTTVPAEPYRSTVQNYATDYLRFDGDGELTVQFRGQHETSLADTSAYSGKFAWWSNKGDTSDSTLTRQFDLRGLAASTPITMEVAMWWDIEPLYDYGYVVASRDGRKWDLLTGQRTVTENPSGNNFGVGYTGKSEAENAEPAHWVVEQFDLTPYAGEQIWLRFEYITDDGINTTGWFIDDIRIPALDYFTDFETMADGWESNGWLLTDNRLPQQWLLQVMEFDGDMLTAVRPIPVAADGNAQFDLTLGNGQRAVLAISAVAPVTTQPATYELTLRTP